MEGQAIELLERQIERLEHYPEISTKLQQHLTETRGQQAALERAFNLLSSDPSALKASVMKVAANVQGMMHALSSDEVMKHVLGSYAFEQFEAASYQALVTAAEQAGEREVASTCSTTCARSGRWRPGFGSTCRSSPAVSAAFGDGS